MNYQLLAEELKKPECEKLDDQAAADALNAATITTVRNVPISEIAEWAAQNGVMPALFAAERDPNTPAALYGAIKTLLTILTPGLLDSWEVLGQDSKATPGAQGIMTGLLVSGLITAEQVEELMTMAQTTTSWAALNWTGNIGAHHVSEARKQHAE